MAPSTFSTHPALRVPEEASHGPLAAGVGPCTRGAGTGGGAAAQISSGLLEFEYLPPLPAASGRLPFASISSSFAGGFGGGRRQSLFFARAAPPRGALPRSNPHAAKKVEYYTVRRIQGDGRCMFRALVIGMAANKGLQMGPHEEQMEADELRSAVAEALCITDTKRRALYEEALISITVDESIGRYCQRIQSPTFWGGESELLVLSRMCKQPVLVYIPEAEAKQGKRWGSGFIPIIEYGEDFLKGSKDRKPRKPVRLLYSGGNHYDLLL